MKRFSRIGLALLIVIAAVFIVWQQRENSRLRAQLADVRNQLESTQKILDEQKRMAIESSQNDDARQREHVELLRLRGEVNRLKQAAKNALSQQRSTEIPATAPKPKPITRDQIKTYSTNFVATVNSGDTIITGGWETKPGVKTYAMISPSFIDPGGNFVAVPDANSQATIEARFIEIPAEQIDAGLQSSLNAGHVSQQELNGILENFQKAGAVVQSTPRMTTALNMQGELTIANPIDVEGESVPLGPTVNFLPRVSDDGTGMSLEIQSSLSVGTE